LRAVMEGGEKGVRRTRRGKKIERYRGGTRGVCMEREEVRSYSPWRGGKIRVQDKGERKAKKMKVVSRIEH